MLSSVMVEYGVQSVMTFGTVLMLMLCVDSLAIPAKVSYQIEELDTYMRLSEVLS